MISEEEFANPEIDAEAELWLSVLFPGLIPIEGKTAWESVSSEIRNILRGFIMGRKSVGVL